MVYTTYLWWWLGDGLWHCFTHIISSVFFLPNSAVLLPWSVSRDGHLSSLEVRNATISPSFLAYVIGMLKPSIGSFFLVNFFLQECWQSLAHPKRMTTRGGIGIYLENPLVSGRRVNFGQETRGPTDTLHFFLDQFGPSFQTLRTAKFWIAKIVFFSPKTANNYGRWRDGITFLGSEKPSQGLVNMLDLFNLWVPWDGGMNYWGWHGWTISAVFSRISSSKWRNVPEVGEFQHLNSAGRRISRGRICTSVRVPHPRTLEVRCNIRNQFWRKPPAMESTWTRSLHKQWWFPEISCPWHSCAVIQCNFLTIAFGARWYFQRRSNLKNQRLVISLER